MTDRHDTPLERLRGSVIRYESPLEPAADEEDWSMLGTESEAPIAITVWRAAIALFGGNRTAADRWMHQEALALEGRRPIDVMRDDPQQVLYLIIGLDYGVYT